MKSLMWSAEHEAETYAKINKAAEAAANVHDPSPSLLFSLSALGRRPQPHYTLPLLTLNSIMFRSLKRSTIGRGTVSSQTITPSSSERPLPRALPLRALPSRNHSFYEYFYFSPLLTFM